MCYMSINREPPAVRAKVRKEECVRDRRGQRADLAHQVDVGQPTTRAPAPPSKKPPPQVEDLDAAAAEASSSPPTGDYSDEFMMYAYKVI